MAREILRFTKAGYITKTNGTCYGVFLKDAGHNIDHHTKLQDGFPFYSKNCKTPKVNNMVGQMQGLAEPSTANGWQVVVPKGFCPNHPNEMILRDRFYGGNYWRAYLTTGLFWKATQIGEREAANTYCGLTTPNGKIPVTTPAEEATIQTTFEAAGQNSTPITENIDWRIALAIALIVITGIYALTKLR